MDYKSLKKIVQYHDKLYYDEAAPVIPDEEYDELFDRLAEMEKLQGWKDKDSPTIRINSFTGKIEHPFTLYSLSKVYSKDKIDTRFTVVTPKIDGVNLSASYRGGNLALLLTRGDGERGESIIHLQPVIKELPNKIRHKPDITIVGEVVTDNKVENFRNYVAGALGLKSVKEASDRSLKFIVHDVLGVEQDYAPRLALAEKLGFITVLSDYDFSSYPQDGVVYRVPKYEQEQNLGYTAKYPRFAVALKQKAHYSAETYLQNIEWVVGRSGVVTPVGIIDPVILDDAKISRVTLHNLDCVLQNNLGKGDKILIERRITPQFISVIEQSKYARITLTDVETALGEPVHRRGPRIYVEEGAGQRAVEYFAKTLQIKGLGPRNIEKMGIHHPLDLYNRDDWYKLGKVGIAIQVELAQPKPYYRVLASLGIPGVGLNTAKLITKHIPKFENLRDIESIPIRGIGEKTKNNVLSWLDVNEDWVYSLPYHLEEEINQDSSEDAIQKKICISGKLDITKRDLQDHLSKYGYTFSESLTKDCYALISSGNNSTKVKRANQYGIPVYNYWNNKIQILKGQF